MRRHAMSVPLDHIDAWVFDLDNTLYAPSAKLFDLIDDRPLTPQEWQGLLESSGFDLVVTDTPPDLIVGHGPKSAPARQCSTGEQKALMVGLVLAHAELIAEAINNDAKPSRLSKNMQEPYITSDTN